MVVTTGPCYFMAVLSVLVSVGILVIMYDKLGDDES